MPIVRNSSQANETFIDFYAELANNDKSASLKEIGKSMLSFIEMINQTFKTTILFGLTSMHELVIQSVDNWKEDWLIKIECIGKEQYKIEYLVPKDKSPWKNAIICGNANTLDKAKKYLIIAMIECEGWNNVQEVRELYKNINN